MAGTVVKPATEVKHRRDQIRRPDSHTKSSSDLTAGN